MTNLRKEVHHEMVDVEDPHFYDESINRMQFYEYTPQTQGNNNRDSQQISIIINQQDIYTLPSESYISIKGQIRRADNNNAYAAGDEIALINNAMMYLFTEIKYELDGRMIESISYPGQITSMMGYLSYPDDFSTSAGLNCCWSKDTTDNANSAKYVTSAGAPEAGYTPGENPNYNQGFAARKGYLFSSNPRGCFEFHIPLTHIFGFANDYKKLIYGLKHTLTLTRGSDTQALYCNDVALNGKVDITNISWYMPEIQLAPGYLAGMRKLIEQKVSLPLAFRARTSEQTIVTQTRNYTWKLTVPGGGEKPRWIIIGFQTARINNQQQNPAVFDNLNLKNAYLTLNSERYPMLDTTTNFDRNEYAKLYSTFDDFKKDYYGIDSLVGGTQVNVPAYKSLFPIIVFDVRKQNETLKMGVMDIHVRFEFNAAVPADTSAYALTISDKFFILPSNGKNLTVVSMSNFIIL